MNIQKMTDEEKSVLLAKLCGWKVATNHLAHKMISLEKKHGADLYVDGNLYKEQNMALAWRVLNHINSLKVDDALYIVGKSNPVEHKLWVWWDDQELWRYPPAEAQRAWLDKILELAYQAGMLTDE